MSQKRLNAHHIKLIALNSMRFGIRGGAGLVYLFFTLFIGMYLAHFALLPIQTAKRELENMGVENISSREVAERYVYHAKDYADWVVKYLTFVGVPKPSDENVPQAQNSNPPGENVAASNAEPGSSSEVEGSDGAASQKDEAAEWNRWSEHLWQDRPALLSALWLMLLFFRPIFTVTGAFNQFSGEVASKGLRYQLFRTSRSNLFLGRFLGTAIFNTAVMAFLVAVVSAFVAFKDDLYDVGDIFAWGLWAFLAFTVVSLPYIAVCSWISSAIDSPFGSLMVCALAIGGVLVAALIGRNVWEPLKYLSLLMPWGTQNYLFHPDMLRAGGAALVCLAYTAAYLFIGNLTFSKRDL